MSVKDFNGAAGGRNTAMSSGGIAFCESDLLKKNSPIRMRIDIKRTMVPFGNSFFDAIAE